MNNKETEIIKTISNFWGHLNNLEKYAEKRSPKKKTANIITEKKNKEFVNKSVLVYVIFTSVSIFAYHFLYHLKTAATTTTSRRKTEYILVTYILNDRRHILYFWIHLRTSIHLLFTHSILYRIFCIHRMHTVFVCPKKCKWNKKKKIIIEENKKEEKIKTIKARNVSIERESIYAICTT